MPVAARVEVTWSDARPFRLSLPEEWARDEHRRQACHVPPEVCSHTRQAQCLEMLDAWGDQVPHGWVTGDDALGTRIPRRGPAWLGSIGRSVGEPWGVGQMLGSRRGPVRAVGLAMVFGILRLIKTTGEQTR